MLPVSSTFSSIVCQHCLPSTGSPVLHLCSIGLAWALAELCCRWAENSLSGEGTQEHVKGVPDGTGKYLAARESTGHRKGLAGGGGCELTVLSSDWIAREVGQGLEPTGTQQALL